MIYLKPGLYVEENGELIPYKGTVTEKIREHILEKEEKFDIEIPPGFIEALEEKKGMGVDVFGESFEEPQPCKLIDAEDCNMINPFTDAYKAFYGEDLHSVNNEVQPCVISDFVRDTFNYYGADYLRSGMLVYERMYQDLCVVFGVDKAQKELNEIMADEFKTIKAEEEKRVKSIPLWNALKNS